MRYTDEPPKPHVLAPADMHALNIFSVKLAEIHGDLQWPLHVFGIVAAHDFLDHNRNIIFSRSRDDCQIINQEVCVAHKLFLTLYVLLCILLI
jgi:hypothetical protein